MRPGRLDRILYVGPPDRDTRKDIFRIRFSTMAIEPGVDIEELATLVRLTFAPSGCHWLTGLGLKTEGCSGAEVASICQDAALAAMNGDIDAPYVSACASDHR